MGLHKDQSGADLHIPQNLHVEGLRLEYVSASQVQINAGACAADDNSMLMQVDTPLSIDITVSGAGGLDEGEVEAPNTWYYAFVIYNPGTETYAGLLSSSAGAPTLPAGYTVKRLVGTVRNNGGSNFFMFCQIGEGRCRRYCWRRIDNKIPLAGGISPGYFPVSLAPYASPISVLATLQAMIINAAAPATAYIRKAGMAAGFGIVVSGFDTEMVYADCEMDALQQIEYVVITPPPSNLWIGVAGYSEEI